MHYYRNHGRPLAAVYAVLQNYLDFGYAVNVLTSKTQFFSPKSVMRSQEFMTPPKGTSPNAEAHCVQR